MNETLNKNLTLIQEVANKALELHKNSTERFSGVNYADRARNVLEQENQK